MKCPASNLSTLTILSVWILWGQLMLQAGAAFQLPPFLQSLSEQSLNKNEGSRADRVFTFPSSILNVHNLRRLTPRQKDLKVRKLMKRMRKNFDPFWMSVERPVDADEEMVKEAPEDPTLVKALDRLNFTLRGPDGVSQDMEMDVQTVLRMWLLQHSTCQVRYSWNNLGILYWPRWVRHGYCQVSGAPSSSSSSSIIGFHQPSSSPPPASCSWPPGMHCVPAKSRRIRILRWQCRHKKAFRTWKLRFRKTKKVSQQRAARRSRAVGYRPTNLTGRAMEEEEEESNDTENWRRKPFRQRRQKLDMRCKWKKIPYPVTDDCFCSC